MSHLARATRPATRYVLSAHNLKFDLVSIFYPHAERLVAAKSGRFEFSIGVWKLEGMYGTPTFLEMTNSSDTKVTIIDSGSYFPGTLAAAAALVCPELPKLDAPHDLTAGELTDEVVAYAMRDAEISCRLTEAIDARHRLFDIKQSISIASMAQKAFRSGFVSGDGLARQLHHLDDSVLSYHGGKNWVADDAIPRWHHNVASYDISSAHPFGMAKLPSLSLPQAWRYNVLFDQRTTEFPPLGVYRVSGTAAPCRWPCLFDHRFNPLRGRFSGVWISGVELNEALRAGELTLPARPIRGHYYDTDRDPHPSAFKAYVEHFYALKSTPGIDLVDRHFYKLLLNSLYGKTIQTSLMDDFDGDDYTRSYYQAGGLFHPTVASFITASTRVHVHKLEHHTKAIHTSTDGVLSPIHTREFPFAPASGLGSIDHDYTGSVALLRRSLYQAYAPTKDWPKKPVSEQFSGVSIIKSITHGAPSLRAHVFEDLIASGNRTYTWSGPNKLRTSVARGLSPNQWATHRAELEAGPLEGRPLKLKQTRR